MAQRTVIEGTCVYATIMEHYEPVTTFYEQDARAWLRKKGYRITGTSIALCELEELHYIRRWGDGTFTFRRPAPEGVGWDAQRKIMMDAREKRMAMLPRY